MRLTVKERILLHLLPYERYREDPEVPREVTQEGVAEGCWASRRHLTQYIRPLMERGLVSGRKAHVRGVRQKRKVYFVTESGKQSAITLRAGIEAATVQVEEGTDIYELTVREVVARAKGLVTPLAILRLASQGEPIRLDDVNLLSGKPRAEVLAEAPRIESFVGRAKELEAITAEGEGPRFFVIRGVPGIGKSSLAARACELLRGKRSLFWHRVRPWDSRDSVLARLGGFLGTIGKPGLRAVLMRGKADRVAEVLREDLPGTEATMVFDDAQEADATLQPFFRLLLDALSTANDVRVLVLTRTTLRFYSRSDVLGGLVREFELEGLSPREVNAYLSQHKFPKEADAFAQRLHGHPLFLELLRAHNPLEGTFVDVRRYLEDEVYTNLPQSEREMMKLASLYRVPVPRRALFADPQWSHDVLLSLAHRSLLRRLGEREERFEAHDTIRDFFADFLTPAERQALGDFAIRQLRALGSEARQAKELHRCSGYFANAVELATASGEQAVLWEALGDVSVLLGDMNAVSEAYRAVTRLAPNQEARVRAHRKWAMAYEEWGDSPAAMREVLDGLEALGDAHSVERGWLLLARSRGQEAALESAKAREDLDAALANFREFHEAYGEAKALLQLANAPGIVLRRAEDPEPRKLLQHVLELAAALGESELAASAHIRMALVSARETGEVAEVEKHFEAAQAQGEAMENYRIRLDFLNQRAALRGSMDTNFEGRAADCREIIRLGRSVRSEYDAAYGTYLLAQVSAVKGEIEEALRGYEEAAEAWLRLGKLGIYGNTLFHIGRLCLMQGNAKGIKRIRAAIEAPSVKEGLDHIIYPVEIRALDRLVEGDLDGARELFTEIFARLQPARDARQRFNIELPRAHYLFGAGLRALGHEIEAQDHIRLAREYIEADRRFGHLMEMENDVPRLTAGMRQILDSRQLGPQPHSRAA